MADLLTYGAAGVALLAAVARWFSIRPAAPTAAQRHLLVALVAIAPSLVFVAPATQAAMAPIDPFPYTTQLASSVLAMLAAYCVVAMLAHVIADAGMPARRAYGHIATLVLTATTMTVLLVAADVEFIGDFAGDFTVAAARHPLLAAHHLLFLGYLGSRMTRFTVLMYRYVRRPDTRPLMRRGMYIVLFAAIAGLLWLAWTTLTMIMIHAGRPLVSDPGLIARILGATAAISMALGATLPAWGGWLQRALHRGRVDRALRGITPLWRLLARVLPAITLQQTSLANPELLLYRRVIEIRDAQRRLLSYVPHGIHTQVRLASTHRPRRHAIAIRTEAAALVAAIDAYRAGHRQPTEMHPGIRYSDSTQPSRLAEARWLIRVYAAMRHDRAVARVVAWARRQIGVDPSSRCPTKGSGDA